MRVVLGLLVLLPVMAMVASAAEDGERSAERYLKDAHSWGEMLFTVGPNFIDLDWNGVSLGPNASTDLRGFADGTFSGEKDGVVDAEEVEDLQRALIGLFEIEFGKYANHHQYSGYVLIDEAEPQGVEVTALDVEGLEGPTNQTGPVTISLSLHVSFPNVDEGKDVHTVKIDLGKRYFPTDESGQARVLAGDLTVTVQAKPNWSIDPASVQPECAADAYLNGYLYFSGDDIDCFTGHSGLLLLFSITGQGEGGNSLPGFEFGLIFVAVGLVGAALRRRA